MPGEPIHLLAHGIALSLSIAGCILVPLLIVNVLIFCRSVNKQVKLMGQLVDIGAGRHNADKLHGLLKDIRKSLRIPYVVRQFLWHERREIKALLLEAWNMVAPGLEYGLQ